MRKLYNGSIHIKTNRISSMIFRYHQKPPFLNHSIVFIFICDLTNGIKMRIHQFNRTYPIQRISTYYRTARKFQKFLILR
ncbi:hypothetical protein SAMN05216519_1541 [Delftia acidovorans]|nr:hypothetical protein SAMN05216519_1541 [Delftia acidovorans]